MKTLHRISRPNWLRCVGAEPGRIEIALSGYGTYGTPESPWGFRRRRLDYGLCYFLIDGGIRVRWAGKMAEVTEGSLFLLAPRVQHDFELLSPERPITLHHYRLQTFFRHRPCWLKEDFVSFRHQLRLRPYFEEISEELETDLPYKKVRLHALLLLAFSAAFRSEQKKSGQSLTSNQQAWLSRFFRENHGRQPGPSELAGALHLSPNYFSRLFKTTYGIIPRVWLVQERLRLASMQLAETQKSIGQVAEDLGYRNAFLFSRQFSQLFGCSPREFRRKHCQDMRP